MVLKPQSTKLLTVVVSLLTIGEIYIMWRSWCVSDALPFISEEALVQYYMSLNDTCQYTCAIIFEEFPKSNKTEGNIKYKIRISERNVQTSLIFD
jgi:hypothetical protein